MKAIILAAGEGTRLKPLTNTTPKPLIKIQGKTIIEHNLESIYKYVSEIIIVVKYKQDLIEEVIGHEYKGVKIIYSTQGLEKGTGAALKGIVSDIDLFVINGDSIFAKKDLEKLLKHPGYGVLVKKVEEPSKYGIFELDLENNIKNITEKPQKYVGDLANLGVYKFDPKILDIVEKIPKSIRGEFELTDAINEFVKTFPLKPFEIEDEFIDIGFAPDILTANSHFLNKLTKSKINGEVEEGVVIKGNIVLEKGAILKSGTYIEGNCYIGKDSSIGPNTYLRGNTTIGEGCKIGNAVEIKNSSIGDKTNVAHLSYIGDSILGNNINIGGGFITANLRHDKANIKIPVKGILTDTGTHKFGIIMGDNTKTGINCSSMPGRVIENNSLINPGTEIK